MKKKSIWISLSILLVLGLLVGIFGCKAPATTTAPASPAPTAPVASPSPAPSPKPTASPTASPTPTTAPPPAQATVIKWRGQKIYPDSAPSARFPKYAPGDATSSETFVKWIKQASGGRLEIDLAPAGSIIPAADSLSAIENGTLDFVGHTYGGYYSGTLPEADIEIGLPFAWETMQDEWDALYQFGVNDLLREAYAEHKAFNISFGMGGHYTLGTTFDISNLSSLKGRKIRALGIYGNLVQKLGASPASIPGAELYMALKLGTVDGCIYGSNGLDEIKLKEVLKYWVINPNMNEIGITLLMNLNKFNALPADIQAMIKDYGHFIMAGWSQAYATFTTRASAVAQKDGYIKLVTLSPQDTATLRAAGISLWDDIAAKSPRCKKIIDLIKQQARDMGRM